MLASLQALRQRQEAEAAALHTAQKAQDERRQLQERLGSLQRTLARLEAEKRDAERSALQLEEERAALKSALDKVGCAPRARPGLPPGPSPACVCPLARPPLAQHSSLSPSGTSLLPQAR